MEYVYSNSIATVALSCASNPNQSCFGGYSIDSTPPFEIEAPDGSRPDDSEMNNFVVVHEEYFFTSLHDQPLGHRAWGLQERLLSPRILSLGMGELFWDCNNLQDASECFPRGLPHGVKDEIWYPSPVGRIPITTDIPSLEKSWLDILDDYTVRDLTYPETDKLVALSAVARRMAVLMQDVYIAGHFWKTLPRTLNWRVNPRSIHNKRRDIVARRMATVVQGQRHGTTSKTPSWSWASSK
jgi:hypothetical protein